MSSKEEEEVYKTKEFTGVSADESFIPTPALTTRPLIKKYFHYLYHTTQKGWSFNWATFGSEVLNSIVLSFILCWFGYIVFSGENILVESGQTSDYWFASFSLYAVLIYTTNCVLLTRADQITWLLIFYCTFLSLVPFLVMWTLFDLVLVMEDSKQWIIANVKISASYYLFSIMMIFTAFFIEFSKKAYRMYWKPTLSDYFLWLIVKGKDNDESYFSEEIFDRFYKLHDPIKQIKRRLSRKESFDVNFSKMGSENPSEQGDIGKSMNSPTFGRRKSRTEGVSKEKLTSGTVPPEIALNSESSLLRKSHQEDHRNNLSVYRGEENLKPGEASEFDHRKPDLISKHILVDKDHGENSKNDIRTNKAQLLSEEDQGKNNFTSSDKRLL